MKLSDGFKSIDGEATTARWRNVGRPLVWILAAFGFLLAGLAGGTVLYTWRPDIGWTVPLGGFTAYVFAFRQGMILWNPKIDRTWRHHRWIEPRVDRRGDGLDPEATIRLRPPAPAQRPRSAIRVVQ